MNRGDPIRIFEKHPSRLDVSNNIEHCLPEPTLIILASTLPGKGSRLAWHSG